MSKPIEDGQISAEDSSNVGSSEPGKMGLQRGRMPVGGFDKQTSMFCHSFTERGFPLPGKVAGFCRPIGWDDLLQSLDQSVEFAANAPHLDVAHGALVETIFEPAL